MADTQHLDDLGQPIIGERVKLLGASGIKTDTHAETGEWVEITVRGIVGQRSYDPQTSGTVREVEVKASTQGARVVIIEAPDPEPEIEGQTQLGEDDPE